MDPELERQLDDAKNTTNDVEAVLTLDQSQPEVQDSDPNRVNDLANRLVKHAEEASGVTPSVVNVLEQLGIVVVAAQEPFVRLLTKLPQFESAVANSSEGSTARA